MNERKFNNFSIQLVQNIKPINKQQRFEGIAFSHCGKILGVVTSDTNIIYLYQKNQEGQFENEPYHVIKGEQSKLDYPHDISFSLVKHKPHIIAVALRKGAINIYKKNANDKTYFTEPVYQIIGRESKLEFSDAVSFIPPKGKNLAVCNLTANCISFYKPKKSKNSFEYNPQPYFKLEHSSIFNPDGLAFSNCGRWLAVANHGKNTVTIYKRKNALINFKNIKYKSTPVMIIQDESLSSPHSVAFTEKNHLLVTNAGANYFSIYPALTRRKKHVYWSEYPIIKQTYGDEEVFNKINACNKQEGGPKGIAIYDKLIAVCSPEHGINIYSLKDQQDGGVNY